MKTAAKKVMLILSIIVFLVLVLIPTKTYTATKKGKAYIHGDGWFYCDCTVVNKTCECKEPEPIE